MAKRLAPAYRTVKVKVDTYKRVVDLVAALGTQGWRSVGSSREGPATISTVFDEAVAALEVKFRWRKA